MTKNNTNATVAGQVDVIGSLINDITIRTSAFPLSFTGTDQLIEQVKRAREFVATSEFSTDEDRKSLNKVKAITNKIVAAYKAELKRAKAEVFAEAENQLADVEREFRELGSEIKEQVDHFERVYRETKQAELIEQAEQRISFDEKFAGMDPKTLLDSRWLNRTVTVAKAIKELDQRFSAIEAVLAVTGDRDQAVEVLLDTEFDTAAAINEVMAERARIEEEKAEAERKAVEAEAERQRIIAEYERAQLAEAERKDAAETEEDAEVEDSGDDHDDWAKRIHVTLAIDPKNLNELTRLVTEKWGGEVIEVQQD